MKIKAVLRDDLSVTKAEEDDGIVYQVANPIDGESYEFGDQEWFLLSRLHSSASMDEIMDAFNKQYDTEISPEQFEQLIDMATEWGLCTANEAGAELVTDSTGRHENAAGLYALSSSATVDEKRRQRRAGTGKQPVRGGRYDRRIEEAYKDGPLSWTWFDPGKLFLAMSRYLSPLRYIVYILPVIVFAGIMIIFNNSQAFLHDLGYFRAPLTLIQVLVYSMFTVNLVSQVGRGVICRALGMDVNGFGIRMILAVIPRFGVYAEGISKLDKRAQMWAHAGPLLIRLSLFGLCCLFWLMTRSNGTHFPFIALMIATVSLVSFLLSVNPLINSNGYKLLSTLLEMPNLRRRAYRSLIKRNDQRSGNRPGHDSSDELSALKLYALASASFWILLISGLAILGATWLESKFQGTGVVLFLIIFTYFVVSFLRNLKKRRASMSDSLENRRGARLRERIQQRAQQQAEADIYAEPDEAEIESTAPKRRWVKYAVIIVLVIIAFLPYPYETGGPFSVLPAKQEWIHAETDGIIKKVFHNGNQYLSSGEVIAKLSSVEHEQSVQTTTAAILEQEAKLQLLLTTPTKEELDLAQKKLETAKVQLKYSMESEARFKKLYESKHVSFEDYEDEKRKMDVYSMEVEEAKANLSKVKAGPHPQEIEAARSELKRLKERLKYEQLQLDMTNLVMPIDGYLVTRNLQDRAGQFLKEGEMFAVVEDSSSVRVEIQIPETDIAELDVGAAVRLKVWTYPDRIFKGEVTEIDRTVTEGSFGEVVIVSAIIPNTEGLLQSGMTGFGKVDGGSKFVIVAFTRMLTRFFQIELWSWIP